MASTQIKNKFYAFVSIFVIVLAAASFIILIGFLAKINNLVFNIDEKIIKEKTTVLDESGFEMIKDKIMPNDNESSVEKPLVDNINNTEGSASADASSDTEIIEGAAAGAQ